MYTREDLVADVITEANNIKQHATPDEIGRLDFDLLDPTHRRRCIYGQMTGDCYGYRATELILKCTPRYFKNDVMPYWHDHAIEFTKISKNVNGVTVYNFAEERRLEFRPHFSAIEAYILLNDANRQNLINLIKGTTQTIDL